MRCRAKNNKGEKRVPLPSKVRPDLERVVKEIAAEKKCSVSSIVEHLLETAPLVTRRLGKEVVTV